MSDPSDDEEIFKDCVYEVVEVNASSVKSKPSNRQLYEDNAPVFDGKNLHVSKTFQKHVADRLFNLLDTTIAFKKSPGKIRTRRKKNSSLVLLRAGKKDIIVKESSDSDKDYLKKDIKKKVDDDIMWKCDEEKAEGMAVDYEWISSQKEISWWAPENKGVSEYVRL